MGFKLTREQDISSLDRAVGMAFFKAQFDFEISILIVLDFHNKFILLRIKGYHFQTEAHGPDIT